MRQAMIVVADAESAQPPEPTTNISSPMASGMRRPNLSATGRQKSWPRLKPPSYPETVNPIVP
jgi:hypothetical protein